MAGLFARGRIAWILAMILGVILIIIGAVSTPPSTFFIVAGIVVFLFGLIMLIISYVTKGGAD